MPTYPDGHSRPWVFRLGLIILFAWGLLCAGCSEQAGTETHEDKPIPVQVFRVEPADRPVVVEAVGRLAANREVTLSAEVAGVAVSHPVDVGGRVEAGQTLVEIDPTDYRLALAEAQANLTLTEAGFEAAAKAYDRGRKLLPRQVIAAEAFERMEAEYKSAQAQTARARTGVAIARERLAKTRISAPFGGLVALRTVETGQTVAPGQPLIILVDLDPMRVKLFLNERDYIHLDRDDPVRVVVEAYPQREFKGRIDVIGIRADPTTNTFGVEVLVDNSDLFLKAGLTARISLTTRVEKQAMVIPQNAVIYREGSQEVFLLGPDQTAVRRRIELGPALGDRVRVLGGLAPGDMLIVTGQQFLESGTKVLLAPPKPAQG